MHSERHLKLVIIDTDPGIDDAAAILLALASPELSVEAITTVYGNGPVDTCTDNAVRILLAAGRLDIPVHKGAGKPLLRAANEGWALAIHGSVVMGGTGCPLSTAQRNLPESGHASLGIISRVMDSPGEVTIIALGRLTNVALALSLEPRLVQSVAEIIVMGGAVGVPGNVSPVASANLYEDPEAAAIVYSSGVPLVQVGLDVCNRVTIDQGQLDLIQQAGTPTTRLLAAATPYLQRSYVDRGLIEAGGGVRYNDLPAVAYAINPELFGSSELYVEIETQSPVTRGQTVSHRHDTGGNPPNVRVCLEVDAFAVAELFTQRILGQGKP